MTLRRPLPLDDPTIDRLEPSARSAIGDMWWRRAASELKVGAQFRLLADAFSVRKVHGEVSAELNQAAVDETRHSEICSAVGERYTDERRPLPSVAAGPLVRFGDAGEELSLLLHVVLLSCVNEVTSTFYLRECMHRSRSALARAATRELLSDDVEHGRIGWAHLASPAVTAVDKMHVAAALPTLLGLSHEVWTSVPERMEPWFGDHGCLGLADCRHAFENAVRAVVLPAMARLGVDPGPAARWAEKTLGV